MKTHPGYQTADQEPPFRDRVDVCSNPIVAAAPVASSNACELIKSAADEVVCPIFSHGSPFAVAGFGMI